MTELLILVRNAPIKIEAILLSLGDPDFIGATLLSLEDPDFIGAILLSLEDPDFYRSDPFKSGRPRFYRGDPFCREDRIRTCDPLVPNQVRYRPALLPDFFSEPIPFSRGGKNKD